MVDRAVLIGALCDVNSGGLDRPFAVQCCGVRSEIVKKLVCFTKEFCLNLKGSHEGLGSRR
jgi:hypothetical protein